MVVFDEAQAIKNAETRRAQAGQRLKAHFRVALTGTPIENYLEELWSLFAVINPGLLGSREQFRPALRRADRAQPRRERASRPARPDPAVHAAANQERRPLGIAAAHGSHARDRAARGRARLLRSHASARAGSARAAQRERAAARIAFTFSPRSPSCAAPAATPASSIPPRRLPGAKLQAFLDLVDDLVRNKHKALVFSQFVGQLERVREALLRARRLPSVSRRRDAGRGARKAGRGLPGGARATCS